jgi:hypothetical protein
LLLYEHAALHPNSPYAAYRFRETLHEAVTGNQPTGNTTRTTLPGGATANRLDAVEALSAEHPSDYSDINMPWGPEWYLILCHTVTVTRILLND